MSEEREFFSTLLKEFGHKIDRVDALLAHASERRLFRLHCGSESFIGVRYEAVAENAAFVGFSRHFRAKGLPVPEIIAVASDGKAYVEEDLGSLSLFDVLQQTRTETDRFPTFVKNHYANVLCDLVRFQLEGLENLDRSLCYNGVHFDAQGMRNDCQYFEEQFVRRQEVPYSPTELHRDFDLLVAFLKEADCNFFCYRDFQARNILIKDGKLFYIDYQSGRQGPLQCDVASLLFQSQAKIPDRDREDLLAGYLEELCSRSDIVQERFKEYYYGFVVLRLMQVLGAYGKLGLGLGKQYFREGIPSAVLNLQTVVQAYGLAIAAPELVRLIGSLPVMEDIS